MIGAVLGLMLAASPARLTVACHDWETVTSSIAGEAETETFCPAGEEEIYFDIGIQLGGVVVKLDRPRALLAGFDAGAGYGFRWNPSWWTVSNALIGVDLFASAGLAALDDELVPNAIRLAGLVVVTVANWFGVGGGYAYSLGLGDREDEGAWLMVVGVSTSL